MKFCNVHEENLVEWIEGSTNAITYIGPAISDSLARKIIEAEIRTHGKSRIMIDLSDEMDRSGYGSTSAVRMLAEADIDVRHASGIRMRAIRTSDVCVAWTPIAERVDSVENVSINGIWFDAHERLSLERELNALFGGAAKKRDEDSSDTVASNMDSQDKDAVETNTQVPSNSRPVVKVAPVNRDALEREEKELEQHPPRDFKEEKETEVYSGYVGFIELRVTGASLADGTTLAVPKELTELGLEDSLRTRLTERIRIDLSDSVDLGAREVNRKVDAFRELFTHQMGPPLGRIFRKSEWDIMKKKWAEIDELVERSNEKIARSLDIAVQNVIEETARNWWQSASAQSNREFLEHYDEYRIRDLLRDSWDKKHRGTRVKIEMFTKDFTWSTLNDVEVRHKIEQAFPDLRETGLYLGRTAWAS